MKDPDADTLMSLPAIVEVLDRRVKGDEPYNVELLDELLGLLASEMKCLYPKAPMNACHGYALQMVRHALTLSRPGRDDDDGRPRRRPLVPAGGAD